MAKARAKKTKTTTRKVYRPKTPQAKPKLTGLQRAGVDIGRAGALLRVSSSSPLGGNPGPVRMLSAFAKKDTTKYPARSGVRGGRGGGVSGAMWGAAPRKVVIRTIKGRKVPLSR